MSNNSNSNSNSDSDNEGRHKGLTLHVAKCIIDSHCYVYRSQVLNLIKEGTEVRISFTTNSNQDMWTHDSPFVEILEISPNGDILGEIIHINRQETDMYPLDVGEKIWFNKKNIIEIPIDYKPNKKEVKKWNEFKKMLTNRKLLCTGPLFTIEQEYSDSDRDSNSDASDDEKMSNTSSK